MCVYEHQKLMEKLKNNIVRINNKLTMKKVL